ncbi:MAG: phage tail tape measure protein [Actinobacteria bacterium]|nr:phage tail tape measure protein [Actinomycetota bacterium]
MPKSLRVKTRFEATEDISKTARRIEKNTKKMNRSIQRGFKKSRKSALGFKSVLKSILAASIISKGFGLLSRGVSEVTTQFISFDDSITAAAVRFKDIGPDAKDFNQQLQTIKKSAREAGATTIFTAEQSAKALDFFARAGFTSTEAMGSLRSMINLSIASGTDFAAAADMSSDLLGAFGLNAKNTAQKIANLNRLNDVLVKTTNSSNVTLTDLFETMKQVGPVATGILGSSLEEAASFAAILGNSGIKSSEAMTALKNIFLRVAAPVAAGKKTLDALGLTLDDGTGKAKNMTMFMAEMGEKLKGFGQIEQAKILDAVFGKRAIAGAKVIFDNIKAVDDFKGVLDKAAGTSKKTADVMQQSLGNRIKGLGSALTEFGFKVLDPFEQKIKTSVLLLTELFRGQSAQPLITAINKAEEAFKLLGISIKAAFEPIERTAIILKPLIDLIAKKEVSDAQKTGVQKALEVTGTAALPIKTGENALLLAGKLLLQISRTQGKGPTAEAFAKKRAADQARTLEVRDMLRNRFLDFIGFGNNEPAFAGGRPNPGPIVNVTTNVNADGVTAETTVEAPKTSNKTGANKF